MVYSKEVFFLLKNKFNLKEIIMDKQNLLKNFSCNEEKLDFSKVLDVFLSCQKQRKNTFTDFLNPVKSKKFIDILSKQKLHDLTITSFGGHKMAERNVIGFFYDSECEQFPIVSILIKYNSKFSKNLTHRDFLGSILGLGIERSKTGDILLSDGFATVYVLSEISDYICSNLEKVSNTKVSAYRSELEQTDFNQQIQKKRIIVTSLRVDVVLGNAFNLSRSKVSKLILSEKAFINWSSITNTSKVVSEKDVLTLRGFGRVEIFEFIGKSKKDRFIIDIIKY